MSNSHSSKNKIEKSSLITNEIEIEEESKFKELPQKKFHEDDKIITSSPTLPPSLPTQ